MLLITMVVNEQLGNRVIFFFCHFIYVWNKRLSLKISGHSCAFYPDKKLRVLYGVPHSEKDIYVFDQIHFHFGNDLEHGSEHSMDGRFFPIEVSTKQFSSNKLQTATALSFYILMSVLNNSSPIWVNLAFSKHNTWFVFLSILYI